MYCKPYRSNGSLEKHGEPAANGWTAEQMSCTKPGSVSSADRALPPIVGFASYRRTDFPAVASSIAAIRPFGPAPITIASIMKQGSAFEVQRSGFRLHLLCLLVDL